MKPEQLKVANILLAQHEACGKLIARIQNQPPATRGQHCVRVMLDNNAMNMLELPLSRGLHMLEDMERSLAKDLRELGVEVEVPT